MLKTVKTLINVLFVLYLAMVLFFCFYKFSSTGIDLGNYFLGIRLDRYAHFIMFFPYPFISWLTFRHAVSSAFMRKHAVVLTVITGLVFAGATEILQDLFFKSRQGDVLDFLADSISIVTGTAIIALSGTPIVKFIDSKFSRTDNEIL
ncbi:MAG TPA: VanZ family protein [Candidatus Coprenecus pullistercoris]|nr:VanZ family protein [Candidatus Coprenecus pullistercoris]